MLYFEREWTSLILLSSKWIVVLNRIGENWEIVNREPVNRATVNYETVNWETGKLGILIS